MYQVILGSLPAREALLEGLGLSEVYEDFVEVAEELVDACLAVAAPKAVYACLPVSVCEGGVLIGDVVVDAPFVAEKLAPCSFAVPYVGTCGAEAEVWAESLTDPLERYWADKLKLMLLGSVQRELREAVKAAHFAESEHMASLNPGSLPQWPISEQTKLFAMLGGGADAIGVILKESFLMVPTKSGSGIYFAHNEHYENCMLCPRVDCPNRRAPFAGNDDADVL